MKKSSILLAFLALATVIRAQDKVIVNDANAQVRNLSSFSEISVGGSVDLYLSPDDHEVVVVSASSPEYRDRIRTEVQGGQLKIWFDNKGLGRWPSNMNLKAYVSFRSLNKLIASGSSDVFVNGVIRSDKLELRLSGASDFKGAVRVGELFMEQSGSSDSQISGSAGKVAIHLSGASDVKGYGLEVDYCDVHASGASDVQITVQKELSVNASGASDVNYKGNAVTREAKTSGASSVSRKD
jgi:Putative auto-transporter adhesin, head GIN domain